MKYVLVDRGDNIVERVELGSDVGVNGARTYFVKRKQIESEKFDQIWKVMTEEQWNNQYTASLQNKQYEWWKDEESYLDIDVDER
jgi:hypothetical protein